jgi:hypothetical protein
MKIEDIKADLKKAQHLIKVSFIYPLFLLLSMRIETLKQRIQRTLEQLKSEEVRTKNNYKQRWPSDRGTFDLLPELVLIRKKRVELEAALKIIEAYE